MREKIQAVLFDLDGTLLDTATDLANAANLVLTYHGLPTRSHSELRPLIGAGTHKFISTYFTMSEDSVFYKLVRQHLFEAYQQQMSTHTKLFPGMQTVLTLLNQHQMPWGIVTNKPYWLAAPLLKSLEELDSCHCLIGAETLPTCKPDPLPLIYAARTLRVAHQYSVYVGDAATDVLAAKNANMYSVAAAYGYRAATDLPQSWAADLMIQSPDELALWLEKELYR